MLDHSVNVKCKDNRITTYSKGIKHWDGFIGN